MSESPYGPRLVDAVLSVLAKPDWQLHFPEYAAVPFYGSASDFTRVQGKSKSGDLVFQADEYDEFNEDGLAFNILPDEERVKRLRMMGRPVLREVVGGAPSGHQASSADIPYSLDVLASSNDRSTGQNKAGKPNFNALRRLLTLCLDDRTIRGPKSLRRMILDRLQRVITEAEGESAEEQFQRERAYRERMGEDTAWSRAVLSVLRRVALDPGSDQLKWRPQYFRYSLSRLVLIGCQLQPDSLRPLGDYIVENQNLVELDLAANNCLVRRHGGSLGWIGPFTDFSACQFTGQLGFLRALCQVHQCLAP